MNYTPVYDVVLQPLCKADVQQKVKLSLQFHAKSHDRGWTPYFDVQSPNWISVFSKNLGEVSYLGPVDPEWLEAVWRSAMGMRFIDLMGRLNLISLPKPLGLKTSLASLRHLELDDLMFRHADLCPSFGPIALHWWTCICS